MIPNDKTIIALHKKYAPNELVFDLVYMHCRIVCEIAEWCVEQKGLVVDIELLRAACLLHDIGTYVLYDAEGHVENRRLYPLHAIIGAKIIADEGFDERIVNAIETHILLGLSKEEITQPGSKFILPAKDYTPQTIEAELLCYADRFHSKHPTFNDPDTFLVKLTASLPVQAERYAKYMQRFGRPDIDGLAKKYDHPVR